MIAYKLYLTFDGISGSDELHYSRGKLRIVDFNYNDNGKYTAIFRKKKDAIEAKDRFLEENDLEPGLKTKMAKIKIW
jgi:hypothetical protein